MSKMELAKVTLDWLLAQLIPPEIDDLQKMLLVCYAYEIGNRTSMQGSKDVKSMDV